MFTKEYLLGILNNPTGSAQASPVSAPVTPKLDILGTLEERSKSVVGIVFTAIENLPYEKIEQVEMTLSNFKAGSLTKNSAKYFLISVLGNIAVDIIEDFLNLDLSIIKDAFSFVGNTAGLFLALGITLDLKRAWKTAGNMSPEDIKAQRAVNVNKFNSVVDDLF
ncbi:MAG: hypothetical protein ACRDD7_12510 [Peptostreptococcaceae bacterium]